MGIDIYAKWRGQTKEEEKSQYTGFSVEAGNVGYLREAYHGGPYVTKYLLSEAFDSEANVKIPAKTLRKRLPATVLLAMYREKKVYGKGHDAVINKHINDLPDLLKDVFATMKDDSDEEFVKGLSRLQLNYAKSMIEKKLLPNVAQAFVDFVELCEKKEKETGEAVTILCSA